MSGELKPRQRRSRSDGGIPSAYPTETATGRRYGSPPKSNERIPAKDTEPRAVRCAQCGCPIKDYAATSTCPFCGSDNILGQRL